MRISIIIFLLLLSKIFYGQDSLKQNIVIKYAPLSLIDPYFCNFQIGTEYRYNNKLSFEIDLSFYFGQIIKLEDKDIKNRNCFKVKPEIKYFFGKKLSNRKYIGGELFYTKDFYEKGSYFQKFNPDSSNYGYYGFEKIESFEYGINIKIGVQLLYLKRLQIDFFSGIEFGYVKPKYIIKINDVKPRHGIELFTRTHEQPIIVPIFGIKIGYKFNLK